MGPWESNPANPVLTAAGTENPVQNLGHADLVETPDGGTAMVLLGVRPVGFGQCFSPLGPRDVHGARALGGRLAAGGPGHPVPTPDEDVTFDSPTRCSTTPAGWRSAAPRPRSPLVQDGRLVITGDGRGLDDVRGRGSSGGGSGT